MMTLFISKEGEQYGPYTLDEVQEMLRAGTVAVTDYVWREGAPDWQSLGEFLTAQEPAAAASFAPPPLPPPIPDPPPQRVPLVSTPLKQSSEAPDTPHHAGGSGSQTRPPPTNSAWSRALKPTFAVFGFVSLVVISASSRMQGVAELGVLERVGLVLYFSAAFGLLCALPVYLVSVLFYAASKRK